MEHIYKAEEWESNGKWHCGDVSALAANSNAWWHVSNLLAISPVDYICLLKDTFHAKHFHYTAKANVLSFSFDTLVDCRKFKNYINKKARENKYYNY